MRKFVNVGTNSFISINEIETVSPPESAPIKRLVNRAKENESCIEVTYGRRVKAVIVLRSGKVVLSNLLPQTIAERIKTAEKNLD